MFDDCPYFKVIYQPDGDTHLRRCDRPPVVRLDGLKLLSEAVAGTAAAAEVADVVAAVQQLQAEVRFWP
jgi:hypothetical protein